MKDRSQIRRSGTRAAQTASPAPAGREGLRRELSQARLLAKVWSSTLPESLREAGAAAFACRALLAFATLRGFPGDACPALGGLPGPLDEPAMTLATTAGETAARLPLLEALHQLTSLYPALLPAKERSARGAFYTPPALAQRLLAQAQAAGTDWARARVLDPAAGGGIFLLHAAERMIAALGDCEPVFALSHIGSRLSGFEIDPHAAALAQGAIEIFLAGLAQRAGRAVPQIVTCGDTLSIAPEPVFDLVIGNPPYGRVTLAPDLRARYARGLYGHANLYGVFTDAALRWTRPQGLVAFLTPPSFLGGQYYSALRRLLAEEAPPVSIDFVHARRGVFEDVLQETLLALYCRGGEAGRARVNALTVLSETEARVSRAGTLTLPSDRSAPWLAPRLPGHGRLIAKAARLRHRLADWGYTVSTGPLVWNRHRSQLRDRAGGRNVHPLVWAESVGTDGRFAYRARKRNHAPWFRLEPGDDWLLTRTPCVLVQRTTAKEQVRRLIAAELPAEFVEAHGGVVVENHLNMVRAIRPAAGAVAASVVVPAAVVAALLNSRVVDDLFRCISGSVAVSAFELEALPLPAPAQLGPLIALVAAEAPRDTIEAECQRLYGAMQ